MPRFLYETHLHTRAASACAVSEGSEYIARYLDYGFSGIMVTDHFFNANCRIDRRLNWAGWVAEFCAGYEEAAEEGYKRGLDVFFAWEETFNGDDYLVYGLDKAWLLAHPQVIRWNRKQFYEEIRAAGGCVIQAHPFRQHHYIKEIHLSPFLSDGVEAANMGNHEALYDGLAAEYARILSLPAVAGSDIHCVDEIDNERPYGIALERKLDSVGDYVKFILEKKKAELVMPEGRCELSEAEEGRPFERITDIRDGNGKTAARHSMCFNDVARYVTMEADVEA
jgi:hypothetical protein